MKSRFNVQESGAGRVSVARFTLRSNVLPPVTDAMPFGEMARFALSHRRDAQSYSPALTGKTPDGLPLTGHQHGHFLASDEDRDGQLDHLTVFAPCGFNRDDLNALRQLFSIRRYGNLPNVRTMLLGFGVRENFASVPLFARRKHWRSVTPFSLPRFPNRGGGKRPRPRDLPESQLLRELSNRGLPEPKNVKLLSAYETENCESFRWLQFHSRRLRKDVEGYGLAGFEIEFAEPVSGPIALGFGCHFGLGLFLPFD